MFRHGDKGGKKRYLRVTEAPLHFQKVTRQIATGKTQLTEPLDHLSCFGNNSHTNENNQNQTEKTKQKKKLLSLLTQLLKSHHSRCQITHCLQGHSTEKSE